MTTRRISGFGTFLAASSLAVTAMLTVSSVADAGSPGGQGGTGGGGGGGGGADSPVIVSVANTQAVEGAPLGQGFATMVDRDPQATPSQYAASAEWGDGSSGPVAIIAAGSDPSSGARFVLATNHAYHYSGSFVICVHVQDLDSRANSGACGNAVAAEAPLAVRGITDVQTNPYCAAVATFTDGNPFPFLGDFEAAVDWGDGTTSAGFIVEQQPGGPGTQVFTVQGCHTYAELGPHTVTTTVTDAPSQASATSTAWVYATTDGGAFVVGDGNATAGGAVTFWGAGWSAANSLSGGSAPDSFKGFAPGASPSCGAGWSASPGKSSDPPDTVPAYTLMLVSGTIAKQGARIDGDAIHIALVRTDSGYAADPGASGTGTVVFQIC